MMRIALPIVKRCTSKGAITKTREAHLQADRDEAQRTCYVALTRARHRVYIGLAPSRRQQKLR